MKKWKIPFTVQIAAVMLLMVLLTTGLSLIINSTFLESFYSKKKEETLSNGFHTLNAACKSGVLSGEEFDVAFESICDTGNVTILVVNDELGTIRSSTANDQVLLMQISSMLYSESESQKSDTILRGKNYVIKKQSDPRMDAEYMVLWGILDDGSYVYMRTALESIRESADITSWFFMITQTGTLVISLLAIILIAQRLTKPIKNLSMLSKRMTNLDFEAKYVPQRGTSKEIMQLGESMNELSQGLEHTISELKTANLELQQDIEKKEEIDEMRKEFLSNVSHELKTPLALIQGYAEGLKECVQDDPQSRDYYCEVIMDEADKMNQMVKKLLTLNQLEFGNDSIEMERFDITELIQGLLQSSSLLAAQEQITMVFEENTPTFVWGDEFKIEEVLSNYLSNALHYASGEKLVKIFYTKMDNRLRVSVFNTGIQIPQEELDKVWIKFYKVDKARTREYGGSGIGLSIVKAIMDSLHQECGVMNHDDGVEFWMELDAGNAV